MFLPVRHKKSHENVNVARRNSTDITLKRHRARPTGREITLKVSLVDTSAQSLILASDNWLQCVAVRGIAQASTTLAFTIVHCLDANARFPSLMWT